MLEMWVFVCAFPILGAIVAKLLWKHEFDWQEIALTIVFTVIITTALLFAGTYREMGDTQVVNGQVTSKERVKVSCSHSYSCHCHTSCSGSGKNRSCSEHCDTCYEHSYDVDWDVHSTVGRFTIDRVDRRGLDEPPRWSSVQINEPVSDTRWYTNYIKGAPESLFNKTLLVQNKYPIPAYPNKIYDYWHINRVVLDKVYLGDVVKLNNNLNLALRQLGPQKQVNIVPVFTSRDQDFARALEAAWLGGKKNDIVIVTGLDKDNETIKWVYVFSWAKMSIVNVEIRDAVMALDKLDVDAYTNVVSQYVAKSFVRRPMQEFEYLKEDIDPPVWCVALAAFLGFFGSLGAGWYFGRPGVSLSRF